MLAGRFQSTNKTIEIRNSVHQLAFVANTSFPTRNLKVTIVLRRTSGSDHIVTRAIPLYEAARLFSLGETHTAPISEDAVALSFNISNGSFQLEAGEVLVVTLDGLSATDNIQLHTVEIPVYSRELFSIEERVLDRDSIQQTLNIEGYDAISVGLGEVSLLRMDWLNGHSTEYTQTEQQLISQDAQAVVHYANGDEGEACVPHNYSRNLVIPTIGVESITCSKDKLAVSIYLLMN